MAEAELRHVLTEAERGTLAATTKRGANFADAAAEYLRFAEHVKKIDRALADKTVQGSANTVTNLQTARGKIVKFQGDLDKALAISSGPDIRTAEGNLNAELTSIAALLNVIGQACNIAELKGTRWQTPEGKVRPEINIRKTFYGGTEYLVHKGLKLGEGHAEKVTRQTVLKAQFPAMFAKSTFYCPGVPSRNRLPHLALDTAITLDHKTPVAKDWNDFGRKGKQPARVAFFINPTNLEGLCGPCNFAKGSGQLPFDRAVEPGFEGPDGKP